MGEMARAPDVRRPARPIPPEGDGVDFLKKFFGSTTDEGTAGQDNHAGHDIRVATCALFLEMAAVDGEFSDMEKDRIVSILREQYDLSEENAGELTRAADRELEESLDIWQFTNQINQNYTAGEKLDVMRLVWRVVYADGKLDAHEDYLTKKVAKLLRLNHSQLIETKLAVLREMKDGSKD